jgi:hypothetical protein
MWRLEKTHTRFNKITPSVQEKYDAFQNAIHNQGMHPREAAQEARCDGYEQLSGGLWSVRLAGGDRCYFRLHEGSSTVEIVEVGGHRLS